jgi:hypothetical protein
MENYFSLHNTVIYPRSGNQQRLLPPKKKNGVAGIARLFGCSLPTANRIKQSGKIDRAITQIGRKIIIDAELALELAGRKVGVLFQIYLRSNKH